MPTTRLDSPAALARHVGQEVAAGDWPEVTAERVRGFADATDDHRWIHPDAARSAAESPYGGPVAHGLRTLSLLLPLVRQAVVVDGVRMVVNYGFDRVRFPSAVPVGSGVRARVAVAAVGDANDGATQVTRRVAVEREGGGRPAVAADWITRLYV